MKHIFVLFLVLNVVMMKERLEASVEESCGHWRSLVVLFDKSVRTLNYEENFHHKNCKVLCHEGQ